MAKEVLFAKERKAEIVRYVREHGKATVAGLSDFFDVSSATIRNDLRELEEGSLLTRTHGGAIYRSRSRDELELIHRKRQLQKEKDEIAKLAIELVKDGDTIILDTGTTTLALSRLLHRRSDVTVVTNDLEIGLELEPAQGVEVVIIGGMVRKGYHCTVGSTSDDMLSSLTVDAAFMGANSFSMSKGATTPSLMQAEAKRKMIAIAEKVVLLCDHTKIGTASFAQFADLREIDILVIDEISASERDALVEAGMIVRTSHVA